MNEFYCAEFESRIQAYAALELALQDPKSTILEFGQTHNGHTVMIAQGQAPQFENLRILQLNSPHPELLNAYFKLSTCRVQTNIAILESSSICDLMEACNNVCQNFGFQPLEIYRATGSGSMAWALIVNGTEPVELNPSFKNVQLKLFSKPHSKFLKFLNP